MEMDLPEPREQARQIRELIKQRQGALQEGDYWYVLSLRWWDLWKDYTRYGDDAEAMEADEPPVGPDSPPLRRQLSGSARGTRPPSIDNTELTAATGCLRLRQGLQEYSDFALLHEDAWQLLVRWYGGGPALKRTVIVVGAGASRELRVDLYPLGLTVYPIDPSGHPVKEEPTEVTFSRSGRAQELLQSLCHVRGIADAGEESVRLWHCPKPDFQSSFQGRALLDVWEKLQPTSRTLEELDVMDGATLLFEQSKSIRYSYSYRSITEWPFFRRMRLEYKRRTYKDPHDLSVKLEVDDSIDASVETERESQGQEATKVSTWYPATVVSTEEDRVLVQFHNREKPRIKLPPILTDGGWLTEKQLTQEVKAVLEAVFKRYATDGKIDKAAMRGLMSCATNMLVQEDSWQVVDILNKYGDGSSVEFDGFLKYWRQKAVSNTYWLEDELTRLFDRANASVSTLSEEEKLLAQGREWIPRTSTRLAQYRSNEYPHSNTRAKRTFRDFRRYDNLDANFYGEWKQAEVLELNWEEMTVLVQVKEGFPGSRTTQRDWFPMESERLAEYQTKSLEVVEEPAPLLARTASRGGVCIRPGACGLQNLGNTCFMNSTLQCLSNCSALRAFFTGGPDEKPPFIQELSSSPLSLNGRLAREFSRLLCNMWSNAHESCAPSELKALVGQKRPEFSGYQQQDAQELLIFLLDGLHEDTNRALYPRPVMPEVESNGRPDEAVAREAWEGHLKRNDSRIVELFQFQIRSEVECPVCGQISVTFDPIMYLSLPVPKPPHSVPLTVVPYDYPRSPMMQIDLVVPRGITFEELERRLWERLQRRPTELPSCFVFADVWSDRVFKTFQEKNKITDIRDGDSVYALEARLSPESPGDKHLFVSVLFRKQLKNVTPSQFSYERIAPPRILGVPWGASNADVHAQLNALANDLLGLAGLSSGFDLVTHIDTYAANRGEALPQDRTRFFMAPQQHVGVNFLDSDAVSALPATLPKVTSAPRGAVAGAVSVNSGVTLKDCLLKNAEREQLSEEDSVYCRRCKEHRRSWKKIEIWTLPSQLIVHLKRFGRDRIDGPLTKITTPVEFPQELDLQPYLARPRSSSTVYDLCGVVNHHGGLGGGHYTAHALVMPIVHDGSGQLGGGEWFTFNDSRVTRASSRDLDHAAGYILFYRRRDEQRL